MVKLNELKNDFESFGYFATDEIVTEAYLALKNFGGKVKPGQDIRAICLDGPPGAGKTSFVETYVDLYNYYFDEEVIFINYECNDTTGKSDLYEEIDIAAVVERSGKRIIIPGCIVEAINLVNEGKKVVLLLDEFDKSRTETDVFFFKFLQSGKINTTQQGVLAVENKYKSNLQVFFCKNDLRELSGPLTRRVRYLNLDYMTPERFYQVAKTRLLNNDDSVSESLVNMVSMMYESAYNNVEVFDRIPSCSELLIAIQDASELSNVEGVNEKDVYQMVLKRMFKDKEELETFLGILKNSNQANEKKLFNLLQSINNSTSKVSEESLREKIINELFENERSELNKKLNDLIDNLQSQTQNNQTRVESSNIKLNGGTLSLQNSNFNSVKNFSDSSEYVKRGENVFGISNKDWNEVGSFTLFGIKNDDFVTLIINHLEEIGITMYENGFCLCDGTVKLIFSCVMSSESGSVYKFYSEYPVIPSEYVIGIDSIVSMFYELIINQNKTVISPQISFNSLIYNDTALNLDEVSENVYHVEKSNMTTSQSESFVNSMNFVCEDYDKVLEANKKILDKGKVLNA